ncbi:hypothetical protein tb265_07760 [Gemmatimonadetes bacterium T265]|nr:hypothetical protein tb265_07760 [Gemmatimonadetes bacterium T265]
MAAVVVVPTLEPAVAGYVATALLAVAWDVTYAGRIAQLRRAPRALAFLSGVCGLLVAPAYLTHIAGSTLYGGRAVNSVAWLWPLATLLVLAQAAYATGRRLVTPLVGVPLLFYDLLVAAVALARYLVERGVEPPGVLLSLSAAQATVLGTVLGEAALVSPLAVLVPLLVPAYPARWRLTRATRALISVSAAFVAGVTALELPRATAAVGSYAPYRAERLSERPNGDLAVGLAMLTHLAGPPPALTVRNDGPLLDSVDVDAVHVRLRPGGLALTALDSLAGVLEPARRDSTLLVVSLDYDPGDAARRRADPAGFDARRLALVDRAARALRPDILLPAGAPYGDAADDVGRLTPAEWERFLTAAAARAHAVNRRIRVAVAAGDYGAADSTLWAWAASRVSSLDVVGFTVRPSFTGAGGVDARLRAAERWARAAVAAPNAPARPKEQWVFDVRGFPVAHGAASQEGVVWHTIAWASARPGVAGVLVGEPGDYTEMTGLRGANGALRPAIGAVRRALRGLREAVAP